MRKINNIKTIIWDFNGTLLDDTDICINCMNVLLDERGIKRLDKKTYRDIFTFPVKDYYEKAGFDFRSEDFEVPAHRFIDLYRTEIRKAGLFEDVVPVLKHFSDLGIRQAVLSAMQHDFLLETIRGMGIAPYFDNITGIRDHLAAGKIDMALEQMKALNADPTEICLVGDTVHDYEVARELGVPVVLVSRGHQSYERLEILDCILVHSLAGLMPIFGKSEE